MVREHEAPPPEDLAGAVSLIAERRGQHLPKLSIRQAAAAADMSEATWRHIESGRNRATPDKIATMARVVGVTPDELERAGAAEAGQLLRRYLHQRAGAEPAMAEMDPNATSEALLQMILQGIDDIRRAPGLDEDQKRSLEKSLIRSLMQNVSGQLDQMRVALEIVEGKTKLSR